jgi:hypothetical protein
MSADPADDVMTQEAYADRVLEERETGTASAAALLSGLGAGIGVMSVLVAPMILGFIAIGCAILGLAITGDRDRFAKIALIIATMGWLIGSLLSIALGNSPISINLS